MPRGIHPDCLAASIINLHRALLHDHFLLLKKFTKKPVKNLWNLSLDERYLIIVVNGEKGSWGKIKVPKDIDFDQLKVISGDSEFDTEYCVTLGFTYQDEILEWE